MSINESALLTVVRSARRIAPCLLLVLAAAWSPKAVGQSTPAPVRGAVAAQSHDGEASLAHNVLFRSSRGAAHSVSVTYAFPDWEAVYVAGVGRVAPQGAISFITFEPEIVFTSSPGGAARKALALGDATQYMGNSTVDLPTPLDFPENARVGFWERPSPFAEHALVVLSQSFKSGVWATLRNSRNALVSTYRPLTGLPEDMLGEVAVLVSHDPAAKGPRLAFNVHMKQRERRRLTRWRDQVSGETQRAAEQFVDALIKDLQSPEKP